MASSTASLPARPGSGVIVLPRPGASGLLAAGLGIALALVAFAAAGGLDLERTTHVEMGLLLAGGALGGAALLVGDRRPGGGRLHGGVPLLAFALLAAVTALSVVWSLAPSDSWVEAGRTLAYLATFGAGIALVRMVPHAWPGLLHGVALACLAVCGWALLTKVLPGALAEAETYARLREPLEYWNAVGLVAALGVPPLLWLGARRSGHAAANALAWPGLFLLLVCLMLSYSRGAILALAAGLLAWFVLVPLRLRGALVLGGAMLAAGPVVAWAFSAAALSEDEVPLPVRADAGRELGAVLVLLAAALLAVGLAASWLLARRTLPPRARRGIGATLLALLGAGAAAGVLAVGLADGGFARQWDQLTNPAASTPANTPGRLTAASSVRARYWEEALAIHARSKAVGAGAGAYATVRTRFRRDPLAVRHAHGYVVQTLADLGYVGLGASLLALGAWLVSAARATGTRRRDRGLPYDAERVGLLTLVAVVVTFGTHSLVDWTWFVPGPAVIALLCAGWVVGRGPLRARLGAGPPARLPRRRPSRLAALGALGVLAAATLAAWSAFQPVRAVNASDAALERVQRGQLAAAVEIAGIARERNPLAVEPLWTLALVQDLRGRRQAAEEALERAVALQPASAEAWRRLGRYRLDVLGRPQDALRPLQAALFLDPRAPRSRSDLLAVRRALGGG